MNLQQVIEKTRHVARFRHLSVKTEKSYLGWITRFSRWCKANPNGTHADKVRGYLTDLAVKRKVSKSTQSQALNAIVFLYRHTLNIDLGDIGQFRPATAPKRLPAVLSRTEVHQLLANMHGTTYLIAALLYGAGLRLNEALSLRIQDIDIERQQIVVRSGKGDKDRAVMLPAPLSAALATQIQQAEQTHQRDIQAGGGFTIATWPRGDWYRCA